MSMQVEFVIQMGGQSFKVTQVANTHKELFEKLSFLQALPTKGPNGEEDLVFQYRSTKEGYDYYSIVSKQAGQEFQFGQINEVGGKLFPKGWQPLYNPENARVGQVVTPQVFPANQQAQAVTVPQQTPTPAAPVQQAPVQQAPVQQAPVQQAPVQQAPVQQALVQQAPVQQQVAPTADPSAVLKKFGIG